jgi:hypothetical protein
MRLRGAPVRIAILALVASSLACFGGLTPENVVVLSEAQGEDLQTADASTQAAVETEIAIRAGAPVLDLLDVSLTQHACSPHPNTTDGYDCTYTADFNFAYETADFVRVQCFLSRAESGKTNVSPGAGQMTISATYASLFYAPGTNVGAFCQMRGLADDNFLAEDFVGDGPYDEAFFLPVP